MLIVLIIISSSSSCHSIYQTFLLDHLHQEHFVFTSKKEEEERFLKNENILHNFKLFRGREDNASRRQQLEDCKTKSLLCTFYNYLTYYSNITQLFVAYKSDHNPIKLFIPMVNIKTHG